MPGRLAILLTGLLLWPAAAPASDNACAPAKRAGTAPTCVIDPVVTGPGITQVIDEKTPQYHRVWLHGGRARHVLLVFMPGSGDATTDTDTFAAQAAGDGFDVIVLAYRNHRTINSYCAHLAKTGADQCWEQIRGMVSFGDRTPVAGIVPAPGYDWPKPKVSAADSIVNRLVRVLDYLGARHRAPWRGYLRADPQSPYGGQLPRTSRIVIAGHSQGGGHAAFLAHLMRFDRVLTFSAPADYHTTNFVSSCTPAAWLSRPGKTPTSRYYGFEDIHSFSFGCDKQGWNAMRYQGAPALLNIDHLDMAHHASRDHELVTADDGHTYPHATFDKCAHDGHGCAVADRSTPMRADGTPVFGAVWRFMYGVASSP